jgi:predicted membrane protein
MKLFDVILLSLAVVFVVIAIHQTMVSGFGQSYWSVMVALLLFFVYTYRKRR